MCREMESILAVTRAAEGLTKACTEAILHRTFDSIADEHLPADIAALLPKIKRRRKRA